MTPTEFFRTYGESIINGTEGTTLFPSVKAAQMALESSWGEKSIGNNYFGIKAKGKFTDFWKGDSINAKTREVISGANLNIKDNFRKYNSVGDSIKDHTAFLQTNPIYRPVFEAKTPEDQARALQAAGYATDPNYANTVISIINKYKLKELDKKKSL